MTYDHASLRPVDDQKRYAEQNASFVSFVNISRSFPIKDGAFVAVQNVNLDVIKSEIIAIVGPSGCGKSTLLNMTAGVLTPSSGQVLYDGAPITDLNTRVGYMTQNDNLLPWRDVAGNISLPLEIQGWSSKRIADRVAELMKIVGLTGFERSYPTQISGGMRKRTALARVLAYDPETLLMDEPFAALDAQLRLKMQMQLRDLSKRLGKTVMFVTHDLDEAVALGDRCALFTSRPGTIDTVVDIPLPEDRDISSLRGNKLYAELTADLWARMLKADKSQQMH